MNVKTLIEEVKSNPEIPELASGDTVKVHSLIKEGDKERIQVFQGLVIRICRRADGGNFTVRRVSHGVGVERIYPIHSPIISKIEIARKLSARRAKLYFLRDPKFKRKMKEIKK